MVRKQETVVSAKIPKKLKEELEKSNVNLSEAMRRGLEQALREKKIAAMEKMLEGADYRRLKDQQIVDDVRKSRDRSIA